MMVNRATPVLKAPQAQLDPTETPALQDNLGRGALLEELVPLEDRVNQDRTERWVNRVPEVKLVHPVQMVPLELMVRRVIKELQGLMETLARRVLRVPPDQPEQEVPQGIKELLAQQEIMEHRAHLDKMVISEHLALPVPQGHQDSRDK
jgi:hypothetical protein